MLKMQVVSRNVYRLKQLLRVTLTESELSYMFKMWSPQKLLRLDVG